jgi:hypothetical protein
MALALLAQSWAQELSKNSVGFDRPQSDSLLELTLEEAWVMQLMVKSLAGQLSARL